MLSRDNDSELPPGGTVFRACVWKLPWIRGLADAQGLTRTKFRLGVEMAREVGGDGTEPNINGLLAGMIFYRRHSEGEVGARRTLFHGKFR
jgi:hypothetical protein